MGEVRSLTPGSKSMCDLCDFSGLIFGNYKGFAWQAPALVCSLHMAVPGVRCSQGLTTPTFPTGLTLCIFTFLAQKPLHSCEENIIMVEKRSHLLRIVLNYAVRSERDSPRLTFRIAISKQSAMSDISFIVSATILAKLR